MPETPDQLELAGRARSGGPTLAGAPPLVLVGGTGRSGTHVIASLLEQHPRYTSVPLEARFHAKPLGFGDLLAGEASIDQFLHKLRTFWWRRIPAGERLPAVLPRLPMGRRVNGLFRILPRERLKASMATFEAVYDSDPEGACRRLFLDLLWPLTEENQKPGLVEMTTDNVMQAGTLGRLFPEAKFILTVRDGRDTGASKVSRRQREHHPTDVFTGVDWWLGRMRRVEQGLREIDADRVHLVGLDSFVGEERESVYGGVLDYLGIPDKPKMRAFFRREMNPEKAHRHRWHDGISEADARALDRHYEEALSSLEAEGSRCAPVLRRALELD